MIVSQSNKREINQIDRRVGSGNHQGLLEKEVEEASKQASKQRGEERLMESMTGRPSR